MRNDIDLRKNEIIKWIDEKQPKSFIIRNLKCKALTFDLWLKRNNIIYHGNRGLKNIKVSNNRKSAMEYINSNQYISAHKLRLKLIEDGLKEEKCEKCGLTEWGGEKIPLELHHKDGNRFNNDLENLKIICPNCHAFEHILKNKEKNENNDIKNKEFIYCECGKIITKNATFCETCYQKNRRKVERPPYEQLLKEIDELGYLGTGRKYNVSDNAIRKWINFYKKAEMM